MISAKNAWLCSLLATGCITDSALRPTPVRDGQPRLPIDRVTPVDDLVEAIRAAHDVPALAAAIVFEDRVIAIGASGVRALGSETPVTDLDLWHLGSCTKSMTATVLGALVERGTLDWETTMAEAFPDLGEDMHAAWRQVTLVQLLRHEGGGLPVFPRDLWRSMRGRSGPPREARAAVARELLRLAPAYPPGQRMLYSNAGYVLVGAAMERAADRSWEDLMRMELFAPLGMTGAGFGAPGTPGALDQPRGHLPGPEGLEPLSPGPDADNPAAIGPAGTVHASLPDWARYVSLHLGALPADTIVAGDTLRLLHAPGDSDYALGWGVLRRPWSKGPVLTHQGSNTLWYSAVWAAPAERFAVLSVCNQGGEAGAEACDAAAARLIALFWEGR